MSSNFMAAVTICIDFGAPKIKCLTVSIVSPIYLPWTDGTRPCLFNLYAEYIMRNAGLEETQAGIKIARRNINNLRYADYHPYGRE